MRWHHQVTETRNCCHCHKHPKFEIKKGVPGPKFGWHLARKRWSSRLLGSSRGLPLHSCTISGFIRAWDFPSISLGHFDRWMGPGRESQRLALDENKGESYRVRYEMVHFSERPLNSEVLSERPLNSLILSISNHLSDIWKQIEPWNWMVVCFRFISVWMHPPLLQVIHLTLAFI